MGSGNQESTFLAKAYCDSNAGTLWKHCSPGSYMKWDDAEMMSEPDSPALALAQGLADRFMWAGMCRSPWPNPLLGLFLLWPPGASPLHLPWLRSSGPFTMKGGGGRVWPTRSVHECSPWNLRLSTAPLNTADEKIKLRFLWEWCSRFSLVCRTGLELPSRI